ncbi:MAG: BatA domain-containing protein [Planctomycetota bacterium]
MSFLALLFGLGALTATLPIIFHLIRRTPKGRTEFSSLMFLSPSPPTLTRRSNIDNILLLLLRVAAIALIAFAFMRPFLRGADSLTGVSVANRRIAILLDTSASMRRTGVWDNATQQVRKILGDLENGDDVSLFTFDEDLAKVVGFADENEIADSQKRSQIEKELSGLDPGWGRSDLGKALVSVADELDIWADATKEKIDGKLAKLQIFVVSDLQKSSKTESLQSYQWPERVCVKFFNANSKQKSNASVQALKPAEDDEQGALRLRVSNSSESEKEQFTVSWFDESGDRIVSPVKFYVVPGNSRVIRMEPEDVVGARRFVLEGDAEEFDNEFFTIPTEQAEMEIVYVGEDRSNDPNFPQFYLRSALVETPTRKFDVRQVKQDDGSILNADLIPSLVVIADPPDPRLESELNQYLNQGGTALFLLDDFEVAESVSQWTLGIPLKSQDQNSPRNDYRMLADIDFKNRIFRPFLDPAFNDFTKIRFWQHQSIDLDENEVSIVARFDNRDPAIWERQIGSGRMIAFASGWQPDQSQLSLSSKFVPMISELVEQGADLPKLSQTLLINDPISLPTKMKTNPAGSNRVMVAPDGTRFLIDDAQENFEETGRPGIYTLETGNSQTLFAVNLSRAETEVDSLPIEQVEVFGVKTGTQQTASEELSQLRDMKDKEIEGQQKLWKWLIMAAMILLIGETWLAGRTANRTLAERAGMAEPG